MFAASNSFHYLLYADDSTLFSAVNATADINKLQSGINKVYEWLIMNNLSLNLNKTECMLLQTTNKTITCSDQIH